MATSKVGFEPNEDVPDELKLKKVLGAMYTAYTDILAATEACSHEWKYYGKKYGWQLKATHRGKALFYLTPLGKSLRVGFALREGEKEEVLNSKLPAKSKDELISSKRYPEGYPLRLTVSKKNDLKAVLLVLTILKSSRS